MNKTWTVILLISIIRLSFRWQDFFELQYPKHFPATTYNFKNNPLTKEKILLGRALFYDPILSKDSSISCASCHSPYNAFAHTDHKLSHGIDDKIGTRNAPALFNLAWQNSFMWDGAINHIDMQALAPISHPSEMAEDIANVIKKLQRKTLYRDLFFNAFGDSIITGEHTLKAIAQFQLTLVSSNSKYDKVHEGKESFNTQEKAGYKLFILHCNRCHTEPLFSNYTFQNNGLSVNPKLNDYGKWMITKLAEDSLNFKVPSLRNLSFTYPYMHDGRFNSLNEVLSHYTNEMSIELTSNEKTDLISFLLTLNDKAFVFDPANKFPKEILLKTKD